MFFLNFIYKNFFFLLFASDLIAFLPSGLTIPGRCEDFKASRYGSICIQIYTMDYSVKKLQHHGFEFHTRQVLE